MRKASKNLSRRIYETTIVFTLFLLSLSNGKDNETTGKLKFFETLKIAESLLKDFSKFSLFNLLILLISAIEI